MVEATQIESKSKLNFEQCLKCSICTVYCPVSAVEPQYPGPKQAGPDQERYRLKGAEYFNEALKLCLNCKRCEVACPEHVLVGDLIQAARIDYSTHTPSLRDRMLANTDFVGTLAHTFAPLTNFALGLKPMKAVLHSVMGIDKHRTFPSYAFQTFEQWYKKHAHEQEQYHRFVTFFHGCYANYNYPQLSKDLVKLMNAIGELELGRFEDNTIDAFGDAYEYLMTMYAGNAGKSGGEFFTPQEVSELLAKITVVGKTSVNKVYDPAAGSGSLLLKFAKVLGKDNVRQGFYGQEINITTYNLCRINMFLHDINYEKFNIAHGDTLKDPKHWDDEPFDAIVSNPPYSIKWDGDSNPTLINDPRFSPAGVLAPRSKADLAFTMHMLSWLSASGTAAIVEFPGALYRGGAEAKIRKYLVDNNYVDAVIQLPPDLFFGTTISTCILVLKKNKTASDILFIDASAEFVRQGNKNKLSEENRQKILDSFTNRQDIDYFAKVVTYEDVVANDYNLSVSSYVEAEDTQEVINITELNADIAKIVAHQSELRTEIDAIVADLEKDSDDAR